MRYLFLLQGAPASGKSTFIEAAGLRPWTVSSDAIRLLFRGPELSRDGLNCVPISSDRIVWRTLLDAVADRLRHGDLTIIDATHTRREEVQAYRQMVEHHRYKAFLVTWRSLSVDECVARNAVRPPLSRIPEEAVRDLHGRLQTFKTPEWLEEIRPDELAAKAAAPVVDGTPFQRLHVIGDLQGCDAPFARFLHEVGGDGAATRGALPANELFVFVGDFLDRGVENGQVMARILALADRPNVIFCEGNHERHLRFWANGEASSSKQFEIKTRVELETHGIDRAHVRRFLERLQDAAVIMWRGQRILITHGGLSTMPEPGRLAFVPSMQMHLGVGPHDFDVDTAFSRNTRDLTERVIQIHGHRNDALLPILAAPRSYNLEGRVEFGGDLRVVTFEDDGSATPRAFPNPPAPPTAVAPSRPS